MTKKDQGEKVKREPTGGSVNLSKRHLEMARDLGDGRGGIRKVTEQAIRNEYVRRFSKAQFEEKYPDPTS